MNRWVNPKPQWNAEQNGGVLRSMLISLFLISHLWFWHCVASFFVELISSYEGIRNFEYFQQNDFNLGAVRFRKWSNC